jgi:hypothetical protein
MSYAHILDRRSAVTCRDAVTYPVRTVSLDWSKADLLPTEQATAPATPVPLPAPPLPTPPPMRGTFIEPIGPTPPPMPRLDQLYTGRLTGTVPPGWTRDGWLMAMKDNLRRTDDPLQQRMFREEIRKTRRHGA